MRYRVSHRGKYYLNIVTDFDTPTRSDEGDKKERPYGDNRNV